MITFPLLNKTLLASVILLAAGIVNTTYAVEANVASPEICGPGTMANQNYGNKEKNAVTCVEMNSTLMLADDDLITGNDVNMFMDSSINTLIDLENLLNQVQNEGAIAMFTTACPGGWQQYHGLDNRTPMGTITSAEIGATGGNETHGHSIGTKRYWQNYARSWDHYYPASTGTQAASNWPSYKNVFFCQKTSN